MSKTWRLLFSVTSGVALVVIGACSHEPQQLVNPSLPIAPRFASISSGHGGGSTISGFIEGRVAFCVSPSSPAGNYTFTVNSATLPAGGTTVVFASPLQGLTVSIPSGDCLALATRTEPEDPFDLAVDPLTVISYSYTSNNVAGGAGYAGTTCLDDVPYVPASDPCGATVTASANYIGGTLAIFSFTQTPANLVAALRLIVSNLDLSKGTRNQLDDKLREAAKAIGKGNTSHACNELDHFIRDATEHPGKKMEITDAAMLAAKANEIRAALGC